MKNRLFALLCITLFLFGCEKSNTENPVACFTYYSHTGYLADILKDTVWFVNCSQHADSYLWEFSDGTTSTEVNPIHIYNQEMPAIISLTAINGSESDVLIDTIYDWSIVKKPNIYLYPKVNQNICISLEFPKGGEIIASIPDYKNGWCVNVAPYGKIDNEFDYLFYESAQPNIWQRKSGLCIEQSKLESFFSSDMKSRGFAPNEINDFIEYWIPRMKEFPYYAIYPQTKETINRVIGIDFSVKPDVFYRLFYCVEGSQTSITLDEPIASSFARNGFTVVEWGVILN